MKLQRVILAYIIAGCRKTLRKQVQRLNTMANNFEPPEYIWIKVFKEEEKLALKYKNKINFLGLKQGRSTDSNNDMYVNIAKVNVPINVDNVLSKGPRFVGGSWANPNYELIADMEAAMHAHMDKDKIVMDLCKVVKKSGREVKQQDWSEQIKNTRLFLRSNKLICLREDKGGRFAIMKEDDFNNKVKNQLHILKFEEKNFNIYSNRDRFIRLCLKPYKVILGVDTYIGLYPSSVTPVRIFASVKTHKENDPLRVMLDFSNAHFIKTARYVNRYLIQILGFGSASIKSSFECVERIKNIVISNDVQLATMDVKEMYGSVSRKRSIEIIHSRLQQLDTSPNMMDFIINFLKWMDDNIFAMFRSIWYKMMEGWPMGLPISGIVTSIYLDYNEMRIVRDLELRGMCVYMRYVDDLLVCASPDVIAICQQCIQEETGLTIVVTNEDISHRVRYLDLSILREERRLFYSLCIKPAKLRSQMHPASLVPLSHKMAGLRSFLFRNDNLCSFAADRINNLCDFQSDLIGMGFSSHLIRRIILQHMNRVRPQRVEKIRALFPYIRSCHGRLCKILADHFSLSFHSAANLNACINNTKDAIPIMQKANIVYVVPCSDIACKNIYIGESKANLCTRLNQHKYTYSRHIKDPDIISIFGCHQEEAGHLCIPNSASVLCVEQNDVKRKVKEALHIRNNPLAINKRDTMFRISSKWNI